MKKLLIFIATIFIITGCIPKATHMLKSYDLNANYTTTSVQKSNKILQVKYPSSVGAISGSRIYYKRDGVTSYYLYSRWNSSLNKLVYKNLLKGMQNRYKNVVGYNSSAKADVALECEILDFYHIVNENSSYVLVTINVKLIDLKNGNIIKSRVFNYKKSIDIANAKNFVLASKDILDSFIKELLTL